MEVSERREINTPWITAKQKVMENLEVRTGVVLPEGSSYTETISPSNGYWQTAHYHKGMDKHYLVEKGCVVIITMSMELEVTFHRLIKDDHLFLGRNTVHNVFAYPGAVFHALKWGTPIGNEKRKENDWWSDFCGKELIEEAIKNFVP